MATNLRGQLSLPPARRQPIASAAILATFVALLVHTMAYAGFFEDPITWVLLAAGASLAAWQNQAPPPLLPGGRAHDHRRSRARPSASGGG